MMKTFLVEKVGCSKCTRVDLQVRAGAVPVELLAPPGNQLVRPLPRMLLSSSFNLCFKSSISLVAASSLDFNSYRDIQVSTRAQLPNTLISSTHAERGAHIRSNQKIVAVIPPALFFELLPFVPQTWHFLIPQTQQERLLPVTKPLTAHQGSAVWVQLRTKI